MIELDANIDDRRSVETNECEFGRTLNKIKYFVTHYTPLIKRKENIINQVKSNNITNYDFIECHDAENLTKQQMSLFEKSNAGKSEISLFYKHVEIFRRIANTADDQIIVVLEDDAILIEEYNSYLELFLENLPESWDILFPGECCGVHRRDTKDDLFYPTHISRGTCMYILNKGVSTKLYNFFLQEKELRYPIDWWMNHVCKLYDLKYFLTEPTLVIQGSETGVFDSTILHQDITETLIESYIHEIKLKESLKNK